MNYFGYHNTTEFDALIFGMPNEMSDKVSNISYHYNHYRYQNILACFENNLCPTFECLQ